MHLFIKKRWLIRGALGGLGALLFLTSCTPESQLDERPSLTVYCGTTMIGAVSEIADSVEKKKNCTIRIIKGGSGSLMRAIEINREGDLYLPGADSYMTQAEEKGLIVQSAFVGINRAAIIVPKGNPQNIPNDPSIFTNSNLRGIFADPDSGSIGRMAGEILRKRGVLSEAMKQVVRISTDSKEITSAIISGEVDMGINWYATVCWDETQEKLDAILIDEKYAPSKRLVLGRLCISKHSDIAAFFIEVAASPEGQRVFEKYGFGKVLEHSK